MNRLLQAALVLMIVPGVSCTAVAAGCSIQPPKHASHQQLAALAKVSKTNATRTALDAVKQPGTKRIKSAELESENQCLIWSFDIGIAGSKVTHEVAIDAGTGTVLSATTETAAQEADELRGESKPAHGT
jgi:hypothetical protein